MTTAQLRALFLRAFQLWNEDKATRLAASFAFYAILALAPLLVVAVVVASNVLDSGTVRHEVITAATDQLGKSGAQFLIDIIDKANKPGAGTIATIFSVLVAIVGASGLFGQLTEAVNSIWNVAPKKGNAIKLFILGKVLSVVMVLVFAVLVMGWLAIDSVIGYMRHHTGGFPGWEAISFVVSLAFLTGVFAVSFKSLPQGMVSWRDVWIGAFVTALGFAILKFVLSLYFSYGNVGLAYGPAGGLVLILLWFYYASQVFFFGVELTFAYSYDFGSHKAENVGELEYS